MATPQPTGRFLNLGCVVHVSVGFAVLFTAFIACQNTSSKMMKDLGFSNIGFLSIALIYLSFAITSLFAAPINRALGTRWTLFLSALTYTIYIASFLLPVVKVQRMADGKDVSSWVFGDGFVKFVFLFGSCLTGAGAGPLWVS